MATSVKGGTNDGKEKRGTSPSSSMLKKSLKPSSSSSSSPPKDENTSSPAETNSKPVPNYLKPTMSSSLDFSRVPKKSGSESSGQKPVHNRRKSFDRPPPSSVVQKTFRGPPGGSRDIQPQRSASFTNKSNTPSAKPALEKKFTRTSSLKDKKVEEQKMSTPKSVKKGTLSSTNTKKKEPTSSSTSSTKAPASVTSESSIDYDNSHELIDHEAIEDDLVNLVDHEVQSLPEMSEMPDVNQELADPTNYTEVDEVQHVEDDIKGSPPLEEDHHEFVDKLTIADDKVALEDANAEIENTDSHQIVEPKDLAIDQQKVDAVGDQQTVDTAGDQQTVDIAGDQKDLVENAEEQQDDVEKIVPEVGTTEALVEEKMEVKEEEEIKKEDSQESDEGKDEQQVLSSSSAVAAAPAVNTQSSEAKKDKQAYNDVIEETATKLMGGRKNKVLALAGAFETVISLQDTKKS